MTVATIPYFLYLSTNQILVYNIIYVLNRTKDNMYSFIVRKRKKKRCNVKASSQVDWLEVFQIDRPRDRGEVTVSVHYYY